MCKKWAVRFWGVAWDCRNASQLLRETVPSTSTGYSERTATKAGKGAQKVYQ